MRLAAALTLAAFACGGCGDDRAAALEQRVHELERQLQQAQQSLRQHGLAADAAELAAAPTVQRLQDALGELAAAKLTLDSGRGQAAMAAIEAALLQLRQQPAQALPALRAAAAAAPADRQPELLDCLARVGGAAVAGELAALLGDAAALPAMRLQAGRSLLEVDPPAGIAAVDALLQRQLPALPELYLLVHLAAESGRAEAQPVLLRALVDRDRSVRCHAATGLGRFAGPASVEALAAAAAGDEYPAVRANALRALQKLDAARAAAVAAQLLGTEQDAAVRAAAQAATTR